ADEARDDAEAQLLTAELRAQLLGGLHVEAHRQRTELELVGQLLGAVVGEATRNRRHAVVDRRPDPGSRDHLAVKDDREAVLRGVLTEAEQAGGDLLERLASLLVEL